MKFILSHLPEWIGIFIMQGGIAAAGLSLTDPLWWIVTGGAAFYAIAAWSRGKREAAQ